MSDATEIVEIGKIYTGKVVRIMHSGAAVEILPGKDGLIHISRLADHPIDKVEDVVDIGDEITVQVIEIDPEGRVHLSPRNEHLNRPRFAKRARPPWVPNATKTTTATACMWPYQVIARRLEAVYPQSSILRDHILMVLPADDHSIPQREMTWQIALVAACIALWFLGAFYLGVGGLLIGIGCMNVIIGAYTFATTRAPLQRLFPALNRRYARPHLGRSLAVRNVLLGAMFIFLGAADSVSNRDAQRALDLIALLVGIPGLVSYLPLLKRARWRRPVPPGVIDHREG